MAIDLFCGLGGWTEGLLSEGWRVVGFDIERHVYGDQKYPAQLVLQNVLTIHGSQFKHADLIVASPPCTEYSYMSMPWSRAKQIAAALRGKGEFPEGYTGSRTVEDLNALFNACFRIQREACEAAGRYIPMIVENVKGAQPWVGQAKAHYGSFYLWGDVEMVGNRIFAGRVELGAGLPAPTRGGQKFNPDGTAHGQGSWFKIADSKERGGGVKNGGGSWFAIAHNTESGHGQNPDGRKVPGLNFHEHAKTGKPGRSFQSAAVVLNEDGQKGQCGSWFNDYTRKERGGNIDRLSCTSSKSPARKAASAQIAKIPEPLSRYIARSFK